MNIKIPRPWEIFTRMRPEKPSKNSHQLKVRGKKLILFGLCPHLPDSVNFPDLVGKKSLAAACVLLVTVIYCRLRSELGKTFVWDPALAIILGLMGNSSVCSF